LTKILLTRDTNAYRNCFLARPGNKLIVADFSSQEPRVLAYKSKDKKLLEIFQSGKDIYIDVARKIFGEEINKSDPRRDDMKALILGTDYGMSEYGLAKRLGCSKDEAVSLLNSFFSKFPTLADYMHEQRTKTTYVTSVAGRKIWLNPYSFQCERNALNAPIQSSAADMMKLAISKMHQQWPKDLRYGIVAQIHDEVVIDTPENSAEEIARFVEDCMTSAGEELCPDIPFPVDAVICDTWGGKKG